MVKGGDRDKACVQKKIDVSCLVNLGGSPIMVPTVNLSP